MILSTWGARAASPWGDLRRLSEIACCVPGGLVWACPSGAAVDIVSDAPPNLGRKGCLAAGRPAARRRQRPDACRRLCRQRRRPRPLGRRCHRGRLHWQRGRRSCNRQPALVGRRGCRRRALRQRRGHRPGRPVWKETRQTIQALQFQKRRSKFPQETPAKPTRDRWCAKQHFVTRSHERVRLLGPGCPRLGFRVVSCKLAGSLHPPH